MFSEFSSTHSDDVQSFEMNFAACGLHTQKVAPVCAVICLVSRHAISVRKLPMNLGAKVRECSAKHFVEFSHTIFVGPKTRGRTVIEKVLSEEQIKYLEIPLTKHFFSVAAHDCLSVLA